ncbi:Teichoic acids export ATP-binding protein TagH [Flavobacterium longum]|uniref:ABC transporter ATP-binding protein n=1 Tax=Flavobacterium longum TaxID=1299340 RepID=UPI0039ED2F27
MGKPVIKVEQLSKAYQIGQFGTGTISRDLERFWITKVMGKEDPFLKIGETNDRSIKGASDIVWSLRDINFEVNQGDAVGIIGRNGAGKSTLLKVLSRVTAPTAGQIKVRGRIASLLEVGTGFHPELTGRENIYLNGAILGMRKKEITRKLDEIIDFSGVERYVDTPVKRYSSGMYVRLAFAVAAHLESEILIVDEVLAVGDAEFQKKCLGKMGDISKGQGRTVLFVSHNMAAVQSLCRTGILLKNGQLKHTGDVGAVIDEYLRSHKALTDVELRDRTDRVGGGRARITSAVIHNPDDLRTGSNLVVELQYEQLDHAATISAFGISIWDMRENKIISISSEFKNQLKQIPPSGTVICEVPGLCLVKGSYQLNCFVSSIFGVEDYIENVAEFNVEENDIFGNGKTVNPQWGMITIDHNWRMP